ncbi:hypothetical protein MJO28_008720 [Puccinia striiformis f. sp. tritici]|uniref:Secreted protein n=3 Tax=Puccinia striiformis TaxID=27350 RepID=A0A2S4W540_9BASI|nr:hypothetical protein Pst134EB_016347 [Puccinia striiformis f. sp. tritici]KAI7949899.1 hypothetical protein MJO28_008720 [Puccinia striiformis f. sp. tritici]KAI9603053.1 hypothetical protein H4Q26_002363 [Puccinia striiformis f. sp. tritici PST-130]POW16895.1 hypothetical protein PSTT_00967 [Puccinia striiformis]POW19128.1 hypothetical protein PSHT_05033 [Puccinia striiformis]
MLFSVLAVLMMVQGRSVIGAGFQCPDPARAQALCSRPPTAPQDHTVTIVKPYRIGDDYFCPPRLDAEIPVCCKTDMYMRYMASGWKTILPNDTYSAACFPPVHLPDPPKVDLTDALRYYPAGDGINLHVDTKTGGSFNCPVKTCKSSYGGIGCTHDDIPGLGKANQTCSHLFGAKGATQISCGNLRNLEMIAFTCDRVDPASKFACSGCTFTDA